MPQDDNSYNPDDYEEELNNPAMEVPSKYLMWRSHPSAIKRGFGYITKDLPLANLEEDDMTKAKMCFDLLQQNNALVNDNIVNASDVIEANSFLESMVLTMCNLSVGFKGFGRSLDTTMIQLKEVRKEDVTKKGKNFRGFR